ncbi:MULTISPECIES: restriction endonuclease [Aeromonas]|uniref:restriction endonuclease n=1 Tax=Aeromonas TaxID=642 RepID=UPI0009DCF319|nr:MULTISPECIES: restriction endonuclease [Aeromonas]MEB6605326.1 restriction endonuclease [Aeromonas sanarellii]
MANIPSQVIKGWLIARLNNTDWISLIEVLIAVIRVEARGLSTEEIAEIAEDHMPHISQLLREQLEAERLSQVPSVFELDEESPPYIRSLISDEIRRLSRDICSIAPDRFEIICQEIVSKIGGVSNQHIGGANDGGIDFIGYDIVPDQGYTYIPQSSKIVILGQAKRYARSHNVNLNEMRQFVGSCKAKINDLKRSGKIGPFTPIMCAFWTTSNFSAEAVNYARQIGVWYMDGISIAKAIRTFEINIDMH